MNTQPHNAENGETLEEAANKFVTNYELGPLCDPNDEINPFDAFYAGANWKSKHMYTPDQVLSMLESLSQRCAEEAKAYTQGLLISDDDRIDSDIKQCGGRIEVDKQSILYIDLNQFLKR